MNALIDWGLPIVQWIQTFRTPFLDTFFRMVSFLGEEDFYILLLPIIYWCLHKKIGRGLAFIFLSSAYLNLYLKSLFAAPRPYEVDPTLYAPLKTSGYGIPSGHAQSVTTTWGYIATQIRTRFWWILAAVLIILVSFSRMYLGDHFPQDVIAGALIGVIFVWLYFTLEPRIAQWLGSLPLWAQLAIAAIVPLGLVALYLNGSSAVVLGAFWGGAIGVPLESKWVRFDHRAPLFKQVLKLLLGIAVVLALRIGLKAVLPEGDLSTFFRYGVIGFWLIFGAPWAFVQTRLAGVLEGDSA